ncbi:MAG: hypothetical protein K0Q60_4132, partial [Microvirga sp.]|nr:hypothetical protein [Microvirga sp.]
SCVPQAVQMKAGMRSGYEALAGWHQPGCLLGAQNP